MNGEDAGPPAPEPGDEWGAGDDDRLRGWIPPADRLWRHPSEVAGGASSAFSPAPATVRNTPGTRLLGGATLVLVVSVALLAGGLALTAAGSGEHPGRDDGTAAPVGSPTTEPGLDRAVKTWGTRAVATSVEPSTVLVTTSRSSGRTTGVGIVAESGGIVVTTAASLAGARSITVTEPDGTRLAAQAVGSDAGTGIAVVRVAEDLPAATFDAAGPAAGASAAALSVSPGRTGDASPDPRLYEGMVLSAGMPVDADAVTATFATMAAALPLGPTDAGCPLVDEDGEVSGMLVATSTWGSARLSLFLPADLVAGVARQLVTAGAVDHGWLGATAAEQPAAITATAITATATASAATGAARTGTGRGPTATGARLESVDADGPAAGVLEAGDVVTAVDGSQVRSGAELRTRLYADPPGTTLAVTFSRGGAAYQGTVVLADNDGDAPEAGPSP